MSEVILTKQNFEDEVLKEDKPVLVDFWATWCGPCKMLSPIIAELAEDLKDTVKVCKANIDEERDLAIKYQISSIPTLLLFKNGQIVDTAVGYHTKDELMKKFNF